MYYDQNQLIKSFVRWYQRIGFHLQLQVYINMYYETYSTSMTNIKYKVLSIILLILPDELNKVNNGYIEVEEESLSNDASNSLYQQVKVAFLL